MRTFKTLFTILITTSMVTMIGCGNTSSSGSGSSKNLVSLDTFLKDLKRNALFLDKAEVGMKRFVTEKGTDPFEEAKCPYTVKYKEVIIGVEGNGLPKVSTEKEVEFENKDTVCLGRDPSVIGDFGSLNILRVESMVKDFSESSSDIIEIEKIGYLKYKFKTKIKDENVFVKIVFDLNKPLFLNPVEFSIVESLDYDGEEFLNVKTEIPDV